MLLLKDARLLTMAPGTDGSTGQVRGDLLIADGKIARVGQVSPPGGCRTVQLDGAYVSPGFIDCHCHVGIVPEGEGWGTADVNETAGPITGHARAIDGVDLDDAGFSDAVQGGVTSVLIHPGSANTVGGTSVAVKTAGKRRVFREPAAVKMSWFAAGGTGWFTSSDIPYPATRMGITALLRGLLQEARDRSEGRLKETPDPAREATLRVLEQVLEKKLQICVHSRKNPVDIEALMRLQDEFGFRFSVHHGDEAHLIAEELARRDAGVVYGPFIGDRRVRYRHANPHVVADLLAAGVDVGLQTDHPVISIRELRMQAGMLVRYGLDPYEALRTLTILPARIMDEQERLGSLEEGKDADLAVFCGHPLSTLSRVEQVYIGGERVK